MNKIIKQSYKSLFLTNKQNFGALWGPFHERPLQDRVSTTAQWPVPYYQRFYKAYPVREVKDKNSLLLSDIDIDDSNWYQAKDFLRKTFKGREVVDFIENNYKADNYIIVKNDVSRMAQAYVADICEFLGKYKFQLIDVANRENARILNTRDLI